MRMARPDQSTARRLARGPADPHCVIQNRPWPPSEMKMTQTNNRFFDEVARLMNDAAGAAQGVKREIDTVVRHQAERILNDLDLVKREEFDAVKDMARLAREENEALKARIEALEGRLGSGSGG
jgi:BMFP domain-containing protein YqiC